MTVGQMIADGIGIVLVHLLIYAAFRPYTDNLVHRIALGIVSCGTLFAIMGPILKNQGPALIPMYFGIAALTISVFTAVFHVIDRHLVAAGR